MMEESVGMCKFVWIFSKWRYVRLGSQKGVFIDVIGV